MDSERYFTIGFLFSSNDANLAKISLCLLLIFVRKSTVFQLTNLDEFFIILKRKKNWLIQNITLIHPLCNLTFNYLISYFDENYP